MRNLILALVCTFGYAAYSQTGTENYTIQIQNESLKNAIEKIEATTNYRFYFDPQWIEKDSTIISKSFSDENIKEIVASVLSETDLNFLVQNNKVILTKNSIIRDNLPDTFFGKASSPVAINETKTEAAPSENPIFQQPARQAQKDENYDPNIIFIGKESINDDRKPRRLSGYLKDIKTGKPASDVTIRVKGKNSSAITNEQGYYSILVPSGIVTLETESIDFNKIERKIVMYSDGKLDIEVSENITLLQEVLINARANEKLVSTKTGVTSIDIENLKRVPLVLGERDIFKAVTILPGVKTTGEGAAGFSVRGGKEDQNLILLDNGLIYNPSHFFGFFSAVNPFTTQKADLYKGSIPAEFGGRLSSVFDITSKNGDENKFSGEGAIGPVTSNLALSTPIIKGKSSIMAGGRATYSDWILKSLDEENLKNSKASFYDAIVKFNHKFNDNNKIEATFYISNDKFNISSDSLFNYSNRLATLKYSRKFNDKNNGQLVLTNTEYKFGINYESNNLNAFDFGYKLNETQVLAKFNYLLNDKHKITYGISSKLYGIRPGFLNPKNEESLLNRTDIAKERGLESGAHISDSYTVNDKLLIDVGFRYSTFSALGESSQRIYQPGVPLTDGSLTETKEYKKNEAFKTYGGLEPRISARYFIADDFSVKASYDKAFQYIHLLSSNTTQSPTDTWKLSDLNVKPQVSQQFSVGFFKNINSKDLELSVEGYYKKSKNFLDYKVGATLLLNENIETELLQGEGKAYGVEFLIKKTAGRLNGWLGYTYSRTLIKLDSEFNENRVNDGDFFAANFDKPHDFSLIMNYKITERYSFSSNFIYQTGRPITYPIGSYQYGNAEYTLYSDRNKFRIPDYFRLDIGFNIEGNHKIKKLAHSFWNISIYNVLGRNNPYSVYFVTESGEIKAYQTSIFAIPIPTVTYNFKF